ncbi:MAG: hypothetical protein GF334_08245 [Candidatus Altiarchaeales archaeon]|nr:hypothetical protein [Candidatus Altiarchaeales archaeon]
MTTRNMLLLALFLGLISGAIAEINQETKKITEDLTITLSQEFIGPEGEPTHVKLTFEAENTGGYDGEIHVDFSQPYAEYSKQISSGESITLPVKGRRENTVDVWWQTPDNHQNTKIQQLKFTLPSQPSVLWQVLEILLVAFIAVMSYRFFSGRAMDFQDWIDEFKGRK